MTRSRGPRRAGRGPRGILVAGVLTAGLVAVSACGGSRVHSVVIPAVGIGEPLAVEVVDEAGIVASIERNVPERPPQEPIAPVDGDPAAFRVTWAGGMCDTAARIHVTREANSVRISTTTTTRPGPCRMAAVYRTLLFRLVEPVPVGAIMLAPDS